MKELNELINDLDSLANNKKRKEYLFSIRSNSNLGRHELKRLACNILIDDNFVDKYYKRSFKSIFIVILSQIASRLPNISNVL